MCIAGLGLTLAGWATAQTFTTLHSFTATAADPPYTNSDGANPYAGLILSGNILYGTASGGGSSGNGTVFRVNTDGTGLTNLHTFTGGSDGAYPNAKLVLSSNTLYGTASGGSSSGNGTVFKVNTDGTGFTNLHCFTALPAPYSGTNSDGAYPNGLILSGNTLYGAALAGGRSGNGTVFAVNGDSTGFTTLYNFTASSTNSAGNYTNSDGLYPAGSLILSGNTLYGTAGGGGSSGAGTVFAVNTNGMRFTTLHSFTAQSGSYPYFTNSDGAYPNAGLILLSNTLYGTASEGGSSGAGTVFAVNTDGTGFTNLYIFTATSGSYPDPSTNSDGASPSGGLILSGNTLYGTAVGGGSSGAGTVFAVNTNGTGFTNLHSFTAGSGSFPNLTNSDGAHPSAGLILSGDNLYGAAPFGGSSGSGTVFKVNTDGLGFGTLYNFTATSASFPYTNSDGSSPGGGLIVSGNTLYGTAYDGGSSGNGTVFKLNTDGTGFTTLHSFAATGYYPTNNDGASPFAGLTLSGNTLYGTAVSGGSSGIGTVFAVNSDGAGFTTLHNFLSWSPSAGLTLSGGTLYGTTGSYFDCLCAGVFAVSTDGTGFTNLYTFTWTSGPDRTNSDGSSPGGGLIVSGNTLYGTAYDGGSSGNGTVFKVNTDGTGLTTLHSFTALAGSSPQTNRDGANPKAGLILSGNTLYGTASEGGSSGAGTVFKVNTDGTGFTTLHSFTPGAYTNSDGANPHAGLILAGNTLYGTALAGGSGGAGTVFAVNSDGTGFTTLHSFTWGSDGALPYAGLILSGNTLYGTANRGGNSGNGTVFSLFIQPKLTIIPSANNFILAWPTNATGFVLQSTTNLVSPAVWASVSPGPVVVNGQNAVTNPVSGTQQFFRLSQ